MKNVLAKLNRQNGESIGEVLVALLISAIALVLLASMITTSTHLIRNSRAALKDYYEANNALEQKAAESSLSGTFTVKSDGSTVKLLKTDSTVVVKYYKNDKAGATQVVSFK